jgi:hypothetical protein
LYDFGKLKNVQVWLSSYEFATKGRDYIYSLFKQADDGTYTLDYSTFPTAIHHHAHWEKVPSDPKAAAAGALDAAYDWASALLIETGLPPVMVGGGVLQAIGFLKDFGPGVEGALTVAAYSDTGYYDSGDVLDATGAIPWLGSVPDLISCGFNLFGVRAYVTP